MPIVLKLLKIASVDVDFDADGTKLSAELHLETLLLRRFNPVVELEAAMFKSLSQSGQVRSGVCEPQPIHCQRA